jgi:hypothetical protein
MLAAKRERTRLFVRLHVDEDTIKIDVREIGCGLVSPSLE